MTDLTEAAAALTSATADVADSVPVTAKPRELPAVAQHVIDSLEAHLGAVAEAVKHGTPGTLAAAEKFAGDAISALEEFAAALRGGVTQTAAKFSAARAAVEASAAEEPAPSAAAQSDDALPTGSPPDAV